MKPKGSGAQSDAQTRPAKMPKKQLSDPLYAKGKCRTGKVAKEKT